MKKTTIVLVALLLALCVGCAHVLTDTLKNSQQLALGQNQEEVLKIMGEPYKTEGYKAGETDMEEWYYLAGYGYYNTMGTDFYVLEFENDKLVSWGKRY